MSMKLGVPYTMSNTVIEFEPDRRIAWQTTLSGPLGRFVGGRIWRYELEAVDGGTMVTETLGHLPGQAGVLPQARARSAQHTAGTMTKTLDRLAELTESPADTGRDGGVTGAMTGRHRRRLGGAHPARAVASTPASRASPPPSTRTGPSAAPSPPRPSSCCAWVRDQDAALHDRDRRSSRAARRCCSSTTAARGDPIVVYGHMDKQPPLGEWRSGLGPYEPVREGDLLYGRGTADDGYATFAAVTGLLAAGGGHGRVLILIEASEESGSPDLAAHLEHLRRASGRRAS